MRNALEVSSSKFGAGLLERVDLEDLEAEDVKEADERHRLCSHHIVISCNQLAISSQSARNHLARHATYRVVDARNDPIEEEAVDGLGERVTRRRRLVIRRGVMRDAIHIACHPWCRALAHGRDDAAQRDHSR